MPAARDFLVRGLLAGLVAGIVAFVVAYVVGEPWVDAAIALEETGADHSHHLGDPVSRADVGSAVPRSLQSSLGLLTGTSMFSLALGGFVGVLSGVALGRFGRLGVRATTLMVVGIGSLSLYAVPFVAYPPSPPGVGQADTIASRSALYFLLLAISAIAAVTALLTGRWAASRIGSWHAGLAATGGYLAVMIAVVVIMPSYNEVPAGFPANVLYEFRVASFLTQLTLWAVLGVVLAELTHRLTHRAPGPGGAWPGRGLIRP